MNKNPIRPNLSTDISTEDWATFRRKQMADTAERCGTDHGVRTFGKDIHARCEGCGELTSEIERWK